MAAYGPISEIEDLFVVPYDNKDYNFIRISGPQPELIYRGGQAEARRAKPIVKIFRCIYTSKYCIKGK